MSRSDIPLRVAVVGGGVMARAHVRALRRTGTPLDFVGIVDPDSAAAAQCAALAATRSWSTLGDLFSEARPDVVHVCTPAGAHFDAAQAALQAGAHVYVEKPFVEIVAEARTLVALAEDRGLLICAGHQLTADPAYDALRRRASCVAPFASVESFLAFRSPTLRHDAAAEARAAQLADVIPHPLYALIAALEWMAPASAIALRTCVATPGAVEAVFEAGPVLGRLSVSLDVRPVASTLRIAGAGGTLAVDFIRGAVTGVPNPGTTPIEKIVNPVVDGIGTAAASVAGVARRLVAGGEYPGLVDLMRRFHMAIRDGTPSPTSPAHLLRVTGAYEAIAARVHAAAAPSADAGPVTRSGADAPVVVVTGASGFLGSRVARELARQGYRVRGVTRRAALANGAASEWIVGDLSRGVPRHAFAGATAVVHAAACTDGGTEAHRRHSIDTARNVVDAAIRAGVPRLVHVSSISVLAPPRSAHEVQDERTPLATNAADLGPYTWGKCVSEGVITERASAAGLAVRIVRPAALVDAASPELPGLAGRRLFGAWHLCLGAPWTPFALCDVNDAARAIATMVTAFDEVPPIVNLLDPDVTTRGAALAWMRARGWTGRSWWVPASCVAFGIWAARWAAALFRGRRPERLATWQVLRPRRFATEASRVVLAPTRGQAASRPPGRPVAAA